MWITWKDKSEDLDWPLTFEQKVDLFYEQTLGWQLHTSLISSRTAERRSVRTATAKAQL